MRKLVPFAAIALVAVLGVGCSDSPRETADSADTESTADSDTTAVTTARDAAVEYAQCMRENGVAAFPDPDSSGQLTIDAIANRSSVDTDSAAFEQALSTCKDLEPPGFTGEERTAEEQAAALRFAQCIRDNGVPDFPDPEPDTPLIDTRRIPSIEREGGMDALHAAMEACGDIIADQISR